MRREGNKEMPPVPEGLGAHLSYLGLSYRDIAVAKHAILPRLAGGADRYNFKERQSQGWGYRQVSNAVSRQRRRSEEEHQSTTAVGRVVHAQGKRGCSKGFSWIGMTQVVPTAQGVSARSRAAMLMNGRYSEQEGQSPQVSPRYKVIFQPSWAETSAFTTLSSLELPTTIAQGARVQRKAI